ADSKGGALISDLQTDTGGIAPAGVAIFGLRTNGILVTEAGVPASLGMFAGRTYVKVGVEDGGAVDTGIAIANPNSQDAAISFSFTDGTGTDVKTGSFTVKANQQQAKFLHDMPFD